VNDARLGSVLRALRRERGWTQQELASHCGLSPTSISRLERGRTGAATIDVLRRVLAAVDARLDIVVRWHGGELDRLLDAHHAAVEQLLRRLSGLPEWVAEPEVTFSIFGERGSIEVLAWHPGRRALLIVEVSSGLDDVGGLARQADRYRRLAREIVKSRGWDPAVGGVWIVIADGRTARRRLAMHRATLVAPSP
jgi:transcriptional regulator with XRE-family HTH domain